MIFSDVKQVDSLPGRSRTFKRLDSASILYLSLFFCVLAASTLFADVGATVVDFVFISIATQRFQLQNDELQNLDHRYDARPQEEARQTA